MQVPDNMSIKDVTKQVPGIDLNNTIAYSVRDKIPVSPDEPIGNREIKLINQSEVSFFNNSREYYRKYGWMKLARDFVAAPFKGRYGAYLLAMISVGDAARWLCESRSNLITNNVCVLLGTLKNPQEVRDLIVEHEQSCVSFSTPPQEFINTLNNVFRIKLYPSLCIVQFKTPLEYVDDVSLILNVTKTLANRMKISFWGA
ncbi:hypothetical protein SJAV_27510 [Sulfurisphaera javensis]|uniref:Uncharacterized protein n=1 Tax=Sulfurisphaera javensis TaxID=2049879 RepID=A0AAT9GVJ3_9CREN